ncbi:MAG TPA: CGNR zinc finger domain-containing protein [Pseudonocardiaceae bacterium]|nr:CGNR zinc finger domain-containing protein [Pseudonocardiaceae bacterium]
MTGLVAGAQAGQETGRDAELVLAFLNTLDVEQGTDALNDEADWQEWAARTGLAPPGDRDHARAVRTALREAVGDPLASDGVPLGSAPIGVTLDDRGVPVLAGADAVGQVLAASVRLSVLGQWDRVKICPADNCRWAFFDHSRNRSRTWCSMRVCGNRTKARIWRERARVRPA